MAKPTTVKEAIKKFEETSGVNASETEKVTHACTAAEFIVHSVALGAIPSSRRSWQCSKSNPSWDKY